MVVVIAVLALYDRSLSAKQVMIARGQLQQQGPQAEGR